VLTGASGRSLAQVVIQKRGDSRGRGIGIVLERETVPGDVPEAIRGRVTKRCQIS